MVDVEWDGKTFSVDSEFAELVLDTLQSLVVKVEDLSEEVDCLSIELADERALNNIPLELKEYTVN